MTSQIDQIINEAEARSKQVAVMETPVEVSLVAPTTAAPFTMEAFSQGSMAVDSWLKCKEYGLLIGHSKVFLDHLDVQLDMTEVQPTMCIKVANPQTYRKTINGQVTDTGESWAAAVAELQRIDPKATPYRSADIPFTILEDIPDSTKKGDFLAKESDRIGHSLSTTNYKNWELFYKSLCKTGDNMAVLKVRIGFEVRDNGKNRWGVLTFEYLSTLE